MMFFIRKFSNGFIPESWKEMYFSANHFSLNALYNIGITLAGFILKIIALFNKKIQMGVEGRSQSFIFLEQNLLPQTQRIWFHCASLGEYEQGLPVLKEVRTRYPQHQIVLTFFSPSGYEIRKNTPVADIVIYLPLDTKSNARRFVQMVHPELTIFVKYEIWPNYLSELQNQQGTSFLIAASFRKEQSYFKSYNTMMRQALKSFDHIFVQNKASKLLLETIAITNVTVAGDTRYDRVSNQLDQNNTLDFVAQFKNDQTCVVIGSSWPEDDALLIDCINRMPVENVKYIVAPHNIKSSQIHNFASLLHKKTVLFSEKDGKNLSQYNVLIIDTIGLLSKIYSYADIAYVGGAMGTTGLHNILEPAVFGVPIIIGKNYSKFPEAFEMIANGGVISIKNAQELYTILEELLLHTDKRKNLGQLNSVFIKIHRGAVDQIMTYIQNDEKQPV